MIAFRMLFVTGFFFIVWIYLIRMRSQRRDRVVVLSFLCALVIAIVQPQISTWVANKLGVGRGVDLAFYVGFLLLFFVLLIHRVRLREHEEAITTVVRELALLKVRVPPDMPADGTREQGRGQRSSN